jgi:hypothetical protein
LWHGSRPGRPPASPGIRPGKVSLVLVLVSVGSKTRGPGCCEGLGADMIALLLCSAVIVLIVAEDDSLDV